MTGTGPRSLEGGQIDGERTRWLWPARFRMPVEGFGCCWLGIGFGWAGKVSFSVLKSVASGSWWKLPLAAISSGDVIGSCD
jgi:hypothetical protein